MNDHRFWLALDSEETLTAFLAVSSQQFVEGPNKARIDDLMLGLYEGDEVWYLSATDAYAIFDEDSVSLFDHERTLLSYRVDAA